MFSPWAFPYTKLSDPYISYPWPNSPEYLTLVFDLTNQSPSW